MRLKTPKLDIITAIDSKTKPRMSETIWGRVCMLMGQLGAPAARPLAATILTAPSTMSS